MLVSVTAVAWQSQARGIAHHPSSLPLFRKKRVRHQFLLFSCSVMSNFWWPLRLQHTRLPYSSLSLGVCSNSCALSWWCHPTISSSVTHFSFCLQPFPASRSFPMRWVFTPGDLGIGVSASASVLPMNIQGWFPLGSTGLTSLLSKRLSRVFSSTTVQKHQYFGAQPSFWSNSHICTWLLEKFSLWLQRSLSAKWCLCSLTCYLGLS